MDAPNDLLPPSHPMASALRREMDALSHMDGDALDREFADSLRVTAERIIRMAAIIRIKESRGDDLTALARRFTWFGYLRRVAYGQVLPDVLVKLQGHPLLLARAATLALPDQRQLIEQETVGVASIEDGKIAVRAVAPSEMTRSEIVQVFARDHIRKPEEQASYLRSVAPKVRRRTPKTGVVLDAKRGGIYVNGEFVSRADLAKYLADLTR